MQDSSDAPKSCRNRKLKPWKKRCVQRVKVKLDVKGNTCCEFESSMVHNKTPLVMKALSLVSAMLRFSMLCFSIKCILCICSIKLMAWNHIGGWMLFRMLNILIYPDLGLAPGLATCATDSKQKSEFAHYF